MAIKTTMAAVTAAVLLGNAGQAEARLMDYRDAQRVAEAVTADLVRDELLASAIDAQLTSFGMNEAQQESLRDRMKKRLIADVRAYAMTVSGRSFDTTDEARVDVDQRLRVLRFNMMSDPRGFASGRKAGYTVTPAEIDRLKKTLLATYIEREPVLRARLDELVLMEEMRRSDVNAVRSLSREACAQRGIETLQAMQGAPFFSATDAQLFLEYAVDAELDSIRGDRLGDPITRSAFVEEAKARFPSGTNVSSR